MSEDGARFSEENSMEENMELMEDKEEEDAEFYERIEAPKFVDFTVPGHYCPDDRYWFCLRVGCDRKHEEEMDSEAIYKNFVLRVMAARSPNVRLQKTLKRNASSKNLKCPLSAPPKSSRSRLSRLAIISSMSQKMGIDKEKVKPLPKVSSTPMVKGKQVAAKYLTTPRNKKYPPNPTSFQSVQNPKPPTVRVPKNQSVAKALVFHSPKKAFSLKTSVELRTPLTKLCEGMKKLEITSQRKCELGYSSKPSEQHAHDSKKSLPLRSSIRKKVSNKERCRTKISLQSHTKNEQDAKSLRLVKSRSKANLSKQCSLKDIVQNDSCTVEAHVKSKDANEEHLAASKVSGQCSSTGSAKAAACTVSEVPSSKGIVDSTSTHASKGPFNNSMNSEPTFTGGKDDGIEGNSTIVSFKDTENLNDHLAELETSEGPFNSSTNSEPTFTGGKDDGIEGNTIVSFEDTENLNDHLAELETSEGEGCRMTQSDDKENASAFDENRPEIRSFDHTISQTGIKVIAMQNTDKKKVTQVVDKSIKGSATNGASALKLKKPKPTNPKPFRLRTDERGILREANLERKNHVITPQSQNKAAISRFQGGDLEGQHVDIQKGTRIAAVKTPKRQVRTETPTEIGDQSSTHQEQKPLPPTLKSNTCQNLENGSMKTKCPSRDVLQPQRMKATTLYMRPDKPLNSFRETTPKFSELREVEKKSESGARNAVRRRAPAGSGASSRGRRLVTIPKEPNFHSIHVPKSCARKIV